MIPRPRSGLDCYLLCTTALLGLLLSACDAAEIAPLQQTPALSVPHGLLDLKTNRSVITPRARAVDAMSNLAAASGLEYFTLEHNGASLAALIKLDLTTFTPHIVADRQGITPVKAVSAPGVKVVVGSSFVSQVRRMQPIGVLLSEGELLQDLEPHGYTRILGILQNNSPTEPAGVEGFSGRAAADAQRFDVIHRSEWPTKRFRSALQAGPGIIEHGVLDISERDLQRQPYFRSFIAACGDLSIVGATLVPVHLYTLGAALLEFFDEHQLRCSDVVNLAGDREALLLVRQGDSVAYLGDPQPSKAGLITFTGTAAATE